MSGAETEVTNGRRRALFGGVGATKKAAARPPAAGRAGRVPTKSDQRGAPIVGYEPRVDLLPGEVHVDRKQRAVVRRAWLVVVLVALVAVLGTGAAYKTSVEAASDLSATQDQTVGLLKQEQSFAEVKQVQAQAALIDAGREVGGSTEIDWGTTLERIQASLPAGVTITGVQIDSATPLQSFTQATAPLQGARVATVTVTASSTELPTIPLWITSLAKVPGFVDANANSVTLGADETGGYTTNLTIHLNTDAYDGKYAAKKEN